VFSFDLAKDGGQKVLGQEDLLGRWLDGADDERVRDDHRENPAENF
jgi:hypothetical protein